MIETLCQYRYYNCQHFIYQTSSLITSWHKRGSTKVYRLTISRAVTHSKSVHRISPGIWVWPRNRPFWMVAGNDLNHQIVESSNNGSLGPILHIFWHFSWLCTLLETPKLGIGHVNGLEDFRWFNSFSRHHSKWPISRPKSISGTNPVHTFRVRYRTTYG